MVSLGTLLCCALPALLVLLGLGAAVASVLSSLPWLVTLSRRNAWVLAVKKLDGVDSVAVSLNEGLAIVRFRPVNRISLEEVREVIRAN